MRPASRSGRALRLLAALAPLALAACVTPPLEKQLDLLGQAPLCCTEVSQFKFQKLVLSAAPTDPLGVTLDETSPAFGFPSGKSFFAAFELPPYVGPYAVTLSSLPRPGGRSEGTILRPRIMLMDESFKVTRTFQDQPFRIGAANALVREFFINPADSRERYLVVYTDPGAHEKQEIVSFTPIMVPVGMVAVAINGRQTSHSVANAAVGSFTVRLTPYRPAVLGQ